MLEKVFIAGALRTPFGSFGGSLKDIEGITLCADLVKGIVERSNISPEKVDQLHLGCCIPFESRDSAGAIIARQVLLKAGLPAKVLSSTVDKACCSSSEAIKKAYHAISLQEADVIIAGGLEMMSRTPHVVRNVRWGKRIGDLKLEDPLYRMEYKDFNPVAVDAGEVALEYQVTREDQDLWALESQRRYQAALSEKKFINEIMPVMINNKRGSILFAQDEFPKPNTTLESLRNLPTVYGSPTITAGNAPGINDGAALVILVSERVVKELDISTMAEIVAVESVADEPRYIARTPAIAIKGALKKADLTLPQIKRIEINEAFAAMPLVSSKILGDNDSKTVAELRAKINVNGGAIAIGHPVGASGARILGTLIYELHRIGGGYGVSAICGGLAQGDAIIVKV